MTEGQERPVKGERGERGERGEGMTSGARRAVVILFALTLAIGAANLFWTAHETNAAWAAQHQEQAAQQRQAAAQQAAQRRQSAVFEAKLCTTLERLAALSPPPGNPASNPARGFDQQQHAILAQLGPDVGCGGGR